MERNGIKWKLRNTDADACGAYEIANEMDVAVRKPSR
jgi:hypothetical protein